MNMKKIGMILIGAAMLVTASCTTDSSLPAAAEAISESGDSQESVESNTDPDVAAEDAELPDGWSEKTHSKDADPNYEVVFPQDAVNRIDVIISPENWDAMMEDMTTIYGELGANQGSGGGGLDGQRGNRQMPPGQNQNAPQGENPAAGDQNQTRPQGNNQIPPGQGQAQSQGTGAGGDGFIEDDDSNPIWVPVTIQFNGDTWTTVGMRFKGNSSLRSSWQSGNLKLPFKLDFDEFEDDYPEIEDQRFYGFKQLSFSSNFKDISYLHEKTAADLFREAGVPAAQTAFCEVYVDYGDGPEYFGLYTLVEVVDDTVIETQFEDDSGNVYKPSGIGATFAEGSFSEESFDKETNQDEADYSDIIAMFDALHAETRISDPQAWRAGLEVVFDVSGFLNYLAGNSVIQNWDTYGIMSHNYYLYHDPTTDLLTWIPWDNNESMQSTSGKGSMSVSLDEVSERWPLIRYLLDDAVYRAEYVSYVEKFISEVYIPETLISRFENLHDLIAPYVVGSSGESSDYSNSPFATAFENSLDELAAHTIDRYAEASHYVGLFK